MIRVISQGMLCIRLENKGIKISKAAISQWLNDRTVLKRNKEKILNALAEIFDVEEGYLACTQIEKKVRSGKETSRIAFVKKWKRKVKESEIQEAREMIRKHNQLQSSISILRSFGIEIYSATEEAAEKTFQLLEDGCIYTVSEDVAKEDGSGDLVVILPDGCQRSCSSEELIQITEDLRKSCLNVFHQKKDLQQ